MRFNRQVALLLGAIALAALALGFTGLTARTDAPRATAVVVERAGGRQVVSVLDGPDPDRFRVDWADDIPVGQPFTVGLGAACGCVPVPATLSPRREPDLVLVLSALVLLALPVGLAIQGGRLVATGRRAQRRAEAVVGVAPGPIVRLLPVLTTSPLPLHAELWRTDGPLLGRVALARVDRAFDPAVPFVAWGGPQADGAVALTSVDGRQLVLPTSGLTDAAAPPALDPALTAVAAALLGWPSRTGPTDPRDAPRVDGAVDAVRARGRSSTVLSGLVGLALAIVLSPVAFVGWSVPRLGLVLLGVGAVAALQVRTRAPLHALVDPVAGPDRELRAKLVAALIQIRGIRVDGPRAHGPGDPADGPGWTPSTPRPR